MSVNRYRIADNQVQRCYGGGILVVDPAGPLVEYTDYATIKEENEELHKDYEALADEHTKLIERLTNCKAEVDRLKAEVEHLIEGLNAQGTRLLALSFEVERLRKAGDFLYGCNLAMLCNNPENEALKDGLKQWNAAKEGKQS